LWLERQGYRFPKATCQDYQQWRDGFAAHSASLVFASFYSGNAASMFGHTFLRINPELQQREHGRALLGYAVGFLANPHPEDPLLLYAYRGLTGSYIGNYHIDPYYQTMAIYGSGENRDLWEYDLKLSPEQMDMLLAHLWELFTNAQFSYYFLDENCSYYILALLQVLYPDIPLLENWWPLTMPLETLRRLLEYQLLDPSPLQRPSLAANLDQSYSQLSTGEKESFHQIFSGKGKIKPETGAQNLGANTLSALTRVYEFRKFASENQLNAQESINYREARLARAKLGTAIAPEETLGSSPSAPHLSHGNQLLEWKAQKQTNHGPALGLRYRAGLHGINNLDRGYEPWSEIRYLDGEASFSKERWGMDTLDFIAIKSLSALKPWQKDFSWAIQGGSEKTYLRETDSAMQSNFRAKRYDLNISAAGGFSWQSWNRGLMSYALAKALLSQGLQEDPQLDAEFGLELALGYQTKEAKFLATLANPWIAYGDRCTGPTAQLEATFAGLDIHQEFFLSGHFVSRSSAIFNSTSQRFCYRQIHDSELALGWRSFL
jgi:hypothetical protein